MKRFFKYLMIILIYSFIYIVLREKISFPIFVSGLIVGLIGIILSDLFLLDEKYSNLFNVKIFGFLLYFIFLLYRIILSGTKAAFLTISGKTTLEFFTYKSKLDDDFKLNLLANSITLTPGTVTIQRSDNELLIMQICMSEDRCDLSDIYSFEKRLKKI